MRAQAIATLCGKVGFRGRVVFAGSHLYGEASAYSDSDCHLVANSCRELFRLIRDKKTICDLKRELNISSSFILTTEWLVHHKFYFVEGHDIYGQWYRSPYDAKLLRNTALKVAYREFFFSQKTIGAESSYHLGKALLQAVWSCIFAKHLPVPEGVPFFSVQGLTPSMRDRFFLEKSDCYQRILGYKLCPTEQRHEEDDAFVLSALQHVESLYRIAPFSFRSYLLYSMFSLKDGRVRPLLRDPDRYTLKNLRRALAAPDQQAADAIPSDTIPMMII